MRYAIRQLVIWVDKRPEWVAHGLAVLFGALALAGMAAIFRLLWVFDLLPAVLIACLVAFGCWTVGVLVLLILYMVD
jgi:hypothetical protein